MFVEVKDPDEKVCLDKGFVSNESQACLHFVVLICLSFGVSGDPVPPVWI